jgi:hypothetical protein
VGNGICAGIFGRGRARVAGSFEGRGGRNCEAGIQSIERVEPADPGEEGGHFIASITRPCQGRGERLEEVEERENCSHAEPSSNTAGNGLSIRASN